MNQKKYASQSGNVLFIILIAVVLFGALNYVVANMIRGGNPETIKEDKSHLYAGEILEYARTMREAVQAMRINGCADSSISFENNVLSDYAHSPVTTDTCKVFNQTDGGGLSYSPPPAGWFASITPAPAMQGQWYFPANTCIPDIGSGAAGCDSDDEDNEDIIAVLPYISKTICEQINKTLTGTATILSATGDEWPDAGTKFTGTFSDAVSMDMGGKMTGCFAGDGANTPLADTYHFFHVLVAR